MTEEEKKEFERQLKYERLKVYWRLFETSVWERYKILPATASLAATLLIVATFNKELLPVTPFIKILLAILLLLIPTSVMGYLFAVREAEVHARDAEKKILDDQSLKEEKAGLLNYLPHIISWLLAIVVVIITGLILEVSFNLK
jgi:hypothetical protein